MCNALVYMANTTSQTVPVDGVISFGNVIHKAGKGVYGVPGSPVIKSVGEFVIDSNFTIAAGAAGIVTVTLYKNGMVIPGANSSITATAGAVYPMTIPTVVHQSCPCDGIITAVLSGVNGTVTNASITVKREN